MPNDKYFSGNPIKLERSRCGLDRKPRWTGDWSTGYLVPIFATSSIMPGDSIKEKINSAIRMSTPAFPTMDDLEVTFEAFFVPHRLILSRKSMSPDLNDSNHSWAAFLGAQDSALNMPLPGDVKLPHMVMESAGAGYKIGGIADCLGMPECQVSGNTYNVNCLKILAYYSIWNEYFREPNTMNPVTYSIGSNGALSVVGTDAGIPTGGTAKASILPLAPVCAYHGYFGSALPWPQRNLLGVQLPLGDLAPVITGSVHDIPYGNANTNAMYWGDAVNGGTVAAAYKIGISAAGQTIQDNSSGIGSVGTVIAPNNLYADLSTATAATVNQFRLAVQTQRWYEHLARCGNKYDDLINGMYGVQQYLPIDRPEYLGGFTAPILMSQVASTVGGSSGSLGQTGAYSLSNPSGFLFNKSFTEHGTLMVVMCVRCRDSFAQGIAREDTRFDRFQFYWEEYASIGEQPIKNKELFVTGSDSMDEAVFGYQEAWAEYRMFPDLVTGHCRPQVSGGLGYVTYANLFMGAAPTLKSFLSAVRQEVLVNRTLQTSSTTTGFQFFGQFEFDLEFIRPMPLYSIPGEVDHH